MELNGSYKSVRELEQVLCEAFEHVCVQDGRRPFIGTLPRVYTVIQELWPDSGNIFQHTVWCRFTYCPEQNWGQFKVKGKDASRLMNILARRNLRLGVENGRQKQEQEADPQKQASPA